MTLTKYVHTPKLEFDFFYVVQCRVGVTLAILYQCSGFFVQVNDYEIVVNFFQISHNLI